MDITRRSFIRWVIASGAAMACPVPGFGRQKKSGSIEIPSEELHGETNKVCHEVRDAHKLPLPAPSRSCDVVVIGGGPSGLAAADEVKGTDFLLLEKEPHLGGNAYTETWEGLSYSTGAAWTTIWPEAQELVSRFKLDQTRIQGEDSACFDGVWIRNFWNGRIHNPAFDQLPYPVSVKGVFRRFMAEIDKIDYAAEMDRLDQRRFSEFFEGYPPQLRDFWDGFGRSNWGAGCGHTSAYLGIQAAKQWFREPRYTWEGGMGIGPRRIFEGLPESARKRVLTGASAYKVRRRGKKVEVSFFQDGQPQTVEAKAAVVAVPKFFAQFLVEGLPEDQAAAMSKMRYQPYLVFNLCFNRVVYNQGYDNWVVGAKHFTDFVPADWVKYADGGDLSRKQVITVYSPRPEAERADFLDDADVLAKAKAAVRELVKLFPGWSDHLAEVRIYRRGHPMPMSIPGNFTRLQPLARRDFPPVYFAHSDSASEVSDFFFAALAGIGAAKKALKHV